MTIDRDLLTGLAVGIVLGIALLLVVGVRARAGCAPLAGDRRRRIALAGACAAIVPAILLLFGHHG